MLFNRADSYSTDEPFLNSKEDETNNRIAASNNVPGGMNYKQAVMKLEIIDEEEQDVDSLYGMYVDDPQPDVQAIYDNFQSTILQWTASELLNEKSIITDAMLLNPLPSRFDSPSDWKMRLYPLLMDELRAQIASTKFEELSCRHCDIQLSQTGSIPNSREDESNDLSCEVNLVVDSADDLRYLERLLTDHIALFVAGPPSAVSANKLRYELLHCLAIFHPVYRSKQELAEIITNNQFPITISYSAIISSTNVLRIGSEMTSMGMFILTEASIAPMKRVCRAMGNAGHNEAIMSTVISGLPYLRSASALDLNHEDIQADLNRLNSSQLEALNLLYDPKKFLPLSIIKGPPGTGKTTMLATLLVCLKQSSKRVLATAPTNAAIAELSYRTLSSLPDLNQSRMLRKLMLVRNLEKHPIDQDSDHSLLLQIHLDSRVQRIQSWDLSRFSYRDILMELRSNTKQTLAEKVQSVSSLKNIIMKLWITLREIPDSLLRDSQAKAYEAIEMLNAARIKSSEEMLSMVRSSSSIDNILENIMGRLSQLNFVIPESRYLLKLIRKEASMVFATVSGAGSNSLAHEPFDIGIIDEASQLVQAETAILLAFPLQCLVLVGDDKQLAATVNSQRCKKCLYDESLMSRLLRLDYPHVLLNEQYRMRPEISAWPNMQFYRGEIRNGINVTSPDYALSWLSSTLPAFMVCDVQTGREECSESGSYYNEVEAAAIRFIVKKLRSMKEQETSMIKCSNRDDSKPERRVETIGIISPYAAQIEMLQHLESKDDGAESCLNVRVSTVDSFQGQECDIIIFSAVRSNKGKAVGFLRDDRRLNVALTRAKYCLIVLCNKATVQSCPSWKAFVYYAEKEQTLLDGKSCEWVRRAEQRWLRAEMKIADFKLKHLKLFENLRWDVEFSSDFKTALSKQVAGNKRMLILRAVYSIALGLWPPFEMTSNLVHEKYRDMLHVRHVEVYRLIWYVDIKKASRKQYLCIWDVARANDLLNVISKLQRRFKLYSEAYISNCSIKKRDQSNKMHIPYTIPSFEEISWLVGEVEDVSAVEKSTLLTKFYPLQDDIAHVMFFSDIDLQSIDLPFVLSEAEDHLIRQDKSMIILGRSGTGKTTVILHRMFLLARCQSEFRQLLVTGNLVLCDAIRSSYASMMRSSMMIDSSLNEVNVAPSISRAGTAKNEYHISRSQWLQKGKLPNPAIITFSQFLCLLDSCLSRPFLDSIRSRNLVTRINGDEIDSILDEAVDFHRFACFYYPHFRSDTVIGDAALLFTEIMTHIKGSLAAIHSPRHCLRREEYVQLADRRHSHLSASQRGKIYDCFERYEELKRREQPRAFDVLDVVAHVYHEINESRDRVNSKLGMDAVFVDEVQDFLPAQIALFQFVCENPKRFCFGGDTAQTIAHGVGFRFETLKDLFYDEFLQRHHKEHVPDISFLTENFRTHVGVIRLAGTLVNLLELMFPYTIDKLPEERSKIFGPLPIFIDRMKENLIEALFSSNEEHKDENKEQSFGANQVILVRDDATKLRIRSITGNRVLVLTVIEAKGLEFTDCLIYNFFSSGPLGNDWRVIYNFTKRQEADKSVSCPNFDRQRHAALCTELKMLYVLVTRTKQHLVICEDSNQFHCPMLQYWLEHEVIRCQAFDEGIRTIFQASSSEEEWLRQAQRFFDHKQYQNAKLCYERAGKGQMASYCHAFILELEGDAVWVKSKADAITKYMEAAHLLNSLGKFVIDEVRCLVKAGQYLQAGKLYNQLQDYEKAGNCFEQAEAWREAARCYEIIAYTVKVFDCLTKSLDFDDLLTSVERCHSRGLISDVERENHIQHGAMNAAQYYHQQASSVKMMEYVMLLSPHSKRKDFLHEHGHIDLLLQLEIECGEYAEAAHIFELVLFDFSQACTYFFKAGDIVRSFSNLLRLMFIHMLTEGIQLKAVLAKEKKRFEELAQPLLENNEVVLPHIMIMEYNFLLTFPDSIMTISPHELSERCRYFHHQHILSQMCSKDENKSIYDSKKKREKCNLTRPPINASDALVSLQQLKRTIEIFIHETRSENERRELELQMLEALGFYPLKGGEFSKLVLCRSSPAFSLVRNKIKPKDLASGAQYLEIYNNIVCQEIISFMSKSLSRFVRTISDERIEAVTVLQSPSLNEMLHSLTDSNALTWRRAEDVYQLILIVKCSLVNDVDLQKYMTKLQLAAISLLCPVSTLYEDMEAVAWLRTSDEEIPSLLRSEASKYLDTLGRMGKQHHRYGEAAHWLECFYTNAHIQGFATNMSRTIYSELRDQRCSKNDARLAIVTALLQENDLTSILWSDGGLFTLYIQERLVYMIEYELNVGTLYKILHYAPTTRGKEPPKEAEANHDTQQTDGIGTEGCFSPLVWMRILNKCCVLLIIHAKLCREIIIPQSLVNDILVQQRCTVYMRWFEELGNEFHDGRARRVMDQACDLLKRLRKCILNLARNLNVKRFDHWCEAYDRNLTQHSSKSNLNDQKCEWRAVFMSHLYSIVALLVVNFPANTDEIWNGFSRKTDMLEGIHNGLGDACRQLVKAPQNGFRSALYDLLRSVYRDQLRYMRLRGEISWSKQFYQLPRTTLTVIRTTLSDQPRLQMVADDHNDNVVEVTKQEGIGSVDLLTDQEGWTQVARTNKKQVNQQENEQHELYSQDGSGNVQCDDKAWSEQEGK